MCRRIEISFSFYRMNFICRTDFYWNMLMFTLIYCRSIGCLVVVIFHLFSFNHFTVHNIAMEFSYGEQTLWQWVSTAHIFVDVFFTIRFVIWQLIIFFYLNAHDFKHLMLCVNLYVLVVFCLHTISCVISQSWMK